MQVVSQRENRAGEQQSGMSPAKVRIGGGVFLYREKAPFVVSGVSVRGAVEYDEAADLVRCHECGEWHTHLAPHVWLQHGMKVRAYKIKHGLNLTSALCNERIRKALIAHGQNPAVLRGAANGLAHPGMGSAAQKGGRIGPNAELRNRNGTCQAQILERLKVLAGRIGRTPKRSEMVAAGMAPQSIEFVFGQKLRDVVLLAGLLPNGRYRTRRKYSKALLVERLRDHWGAHGRVPTESDFSRRMVPGRATYKEYFGSWENAVFAAGLDKAYAEQLQALSGGRRLYTVETLEAIMRAYIDRTGEFPSQKVWDSGNGELPTRKTFSRYMADLGGFVNRMRDYASSLQNETLKSLKIA